MLSEHEKYTAVWDNPAYRKNSPGYNQRDDIVLWLKENEALTVWDVGCGTGRLLQHLSDLGYGCTGMDLAENAPSDWKDAFTAADITDPALLLMDLFERHAVVCTDVLEHLPTDSIDTALANLAGLATKCAYLQVATFHDPGTQWGVDAPLHLTVQPLNWWVPRISEHFKIVNQHGANGRLIFLCRTK